MGRIYFTDADVSEFDAEHGEIVGYFESTKAERWDGDTEWDGNNRVDLNTRSGFTSQSLWRSAGGRWVLEHDASRYNNGGVTYALVNLTRAREWLLFNNHDDAAEKYFGEIAEERGPGRPEIGDRIGVRLPDELRTWVEHRAKQWGDVPLAEAIRRMVQNDREAQAQAERQAASAALPEPREFHKGDTIPAEVRAVVDERGYRWERTGETATWWVCGDLCFEPLPVTTEKLIASYGPATEADA